MQHGENDQEQGCASHAFLINLIQQMEFALSTTHDLGIAHGALPPIIILLDGGYRLWVADFGLARFYPPPYLAPEFIEVALTSFQEGAMTTFWRRVDPRSDQYMLSILCQQILTRLLPAVDYRFASPVLERASHQKPARRFQSCELFVQELIAELMQGLTVDAWPMSLEKRPERVPSMVNYQLTMPALPPSAEEWGNAGISSL